MLKFDLDVAKFPEIRLLSEMMRATVLKDHIVCVSYITSVYRLVGSIETDSHRAMPGRHEVGFSRLWDEGDTKFGLTGGSMD